MPSLIDLTLEGLQVARHRPSPRTVTVVWTPTDAASVLVVTLCIPMALA